MFSFLRRRDLCFSKYSSFVIVRFNSTNSTNTCEAISALKKYHFESSKTVVALFRENGFTNTQISKLVRAYPHLLSSKIDKTLKPKFDFFESQGISGSDFAQVVCRNPFVLSASLEKKIIPCFELMRSIVHSDAKLLTMLKRSARVLVQDPHKNLIPNVALLRAHGVPANNISKLLITQPRAFLKQTSGFHETVEKVKQMKFDPMQYSFLSAIHGLTSLTRSSLEAKFDVYRRWGLSEDEVKYMFRKFPPSLMISEKNIMSTMNYFVNEMGYTPSLIAKQATILGISLEKRIIPRCSVIQILISKGLVGSDTSPVSFLARPEEAFLKKYVIKFEKEVPELLAIYQGKGR